MQLFTSLNWLLRQGGGGAGPGRAFPTTLDFTPNFTPESAQKAPLENETIPVCVIPSGAIRSY